MDKVLTINDWWDGPVMGLATYNGVSGMNGVLPIQKLIWTHSIKSICIIV